MFDIHNFNQDKRGIEKVFHLLFIHYKQYQQTFPQLSISDLEEVVRMEALDEFADYEDLFGFCAEIVGVNHDLIVNCVDDIKNVSCKPFT